MLQFCLRHKISSQWHTRRFFLPRDAVLVRYMRYMSVRLSQVGILLERPKESRWFLAGSLPYKKLGIFKNNGTFRGKFVSKSEFRDKISPRHVDCSTVAGVVNFLRLTTVPSLLHRTSTFVYSAMVVRRTGPSAAADTFFLEWNSRAVDET